MTIRISSVLKLICMGPLACGPLAHGQQGNVAGPLAGFVFDSAAQALRPIRGVAGAATLGSPLDAGFSLASAFVAPRQDSAFVKAADGTVHFFVMNGGIASEQSIPGLGPVERIAFSPSGTAAALYAAGSVQLVTGLPGAPAIAGGLRMGSGERSRPALASFAVSDDGAYVLVAAGTSVRLLSQSAGSRSLMEPGYGASVAFAPGNHDAAVGVRGAGLTLIHDAAGAAMQEMISPDDPAFAAIAGLAFSADGQKLFVASVSAQSVAGFDLAGGKRSDFACGCVPSGFSPMGNLFRLNELGAGPLWLLDASANGPRIVFVPALKGNS